MEGGGNYAVLEQKNQQLRHENLELKSQLKELQRLIFGAKSERFVASAPHEQLDMFAPQQAPDTTPPAKEHISYDRQKKTKAKPVRAMLPAHLPREEEVIKPEGWVEGAKQLGQEVTELLEYIPGRLYVRRIVRPKYLINSTIILAPLPTLPIPKGKCGSRIFGLPAGE